MSKASIKEIESEIANYQPGKRLADAMRELGEAGFYFGGHGTCVLSGEEDFSLIYYLDRAKTRYVYVALTKGHSTVYQTVDDDDEEYEPIHTRGPGSAATAAKKLVQKLLAEKKPALTKNS